MDFDLSTTLHTRTCCHVFCWKRVRLQKRQFHTGFTDLWHDLPNCRRLHFKLSSQSLETEDRPVHTISL